MKRIASILILACFYFAANGQVNYLDSSFNATGILALNHAGGEDVPTVLLTRPNGKSLEIGFAFFDTRVPATTLTTVVVAQFDLDGKPDLTFGQHGIVVLDQLKTDANAVGAALQSDGKLLITGRYLNSTVGPHHFVARLTEDGALDDSFGVKGVTGHSDPDLVVWGHSLAIQYDGKIVMGGSKFTFVPPGSGYQTRALIRFNPDGLVDSSFGNNGLVLSELSMDCDVLALGPDHTIYAGGFDNNFKPLLERYLPNGLPDPNFGVGGVVQLSGNGGLSHILIQPNGKIITGGNGLDYIRRLNVDGSNDLSFENASILDDEALIGIAAGLDGKIVVGTYSDFGLLRFFRYFPQGQVDPTFGEDLPVPLNYILDVGLTLQADGKLVLGGGRLGDFGLMDFCLLRLSKTLAVDSLYGEAGFVFQNFGTNHSGAHAVWIDAQDRIVVGGEAIYVDGTAIVNLPTEHNMGFVSRFQPNGVLDSTFFKGGVRPLPYYFDVLNLTTQQPDGKIIAAGGFYSGFAVVRLLADGYGDADFGPYSNGSTVYYLDWGFIEASASAVAISPDSAILVMGKVTDIDDKHKIALVRFNPDGFQDMSFGTDGLALAEGISGNFELNAGLVQPDGKILVTGTYSSPVANIFLVRFLPDGTLDPSFGNGGVVLKPFTGLNYRPNALALQPDGQILLCGNQGSVNTIVGRLNPNGSKDNTFSGDGLAVINTAAAENGNALKIQANGKIVVAGWSSSSSGSNQADPLLLRLRADGSLDSSFAGTGYVVTNLPGANLLEALAIQPDGNYITAGYSNNDYLLIRYLSKLNVGLLAVQGFQSEVLVYPNPVQGQVTFSYALTAASQVSLELFDMQGKRCHSFLLTENRSQGEHTESLYFPQTLPPGVYTLRVQAEQGSRAVQVMVME